MKKKIMVLLLGIILLLSGLSYAGDDDEDRGWLLQRIEVSLEYDLIKN